MWWTAAEQPLRLEAYYCTNGIATMIGGLLGYAIGHITTGALDRWMYVFIIFGSVSIVWGVVVLLFARSTFDRKVLDRKRKICCCGAGGQQQTRRQEHPLQEISINAGIAGSKDVDLVYHGCWCTGAQFCAHECKCLFLSS